MADDRTFVIIGGGQSGGWTAKTLRDASEQQFRHPSHPPILPLQLRATRCSMVMGHLRGES